MPNREVVANTKRTPLSTTALERIKKYVRNRALDLYTSDDDRLYCEVIAARLGVSPRTVDRVLTGLMLENERFAVTLRVTGCPKRAMRAAQSVWGEMEGAA